jgi:Protein of unknown function (DUF3667)
MVCQTCGDRSMQKYCPNCGEKKFDHHELTLKHFFSEALESFAHFDNKFLRSLKTLIFYPGRLSLDFTEGLRVRFMKPLQLFLVMNLIFFFLVPQNPFALPLYNYVTYKPFTDYHTVETVEEKMKEKNLTMKELSAVFDHQIKTESKEFVFLYVIFYAFVLMILMIAYKKGLAEHLIFSAHFMSFYLILSFAQYFLITWPFYALSDVNYSQTFDTITVVITVIILAVYLFAAFRTFYRSNILWSGLSSIIIAGTFFICIQFYRMFLFHKILSWE